MVLEEALVSPLRQASSPRWNGYEFSSGSAMIPLHGISYK